MAPRGIGNHKKTPFDPAESNPPFLTVVVAGVLSDEPVLVQKEMCGVVEWDAVLGNILRRFALVAFTLHQSM